MKTKFQIKQEIEVLEQSCHRYDMAGRVADANMAEARLDDLYEVFLNMRDDQLAAVELYWF